MSAEDIAKDLLMKAGMWWPDANSGTLRSAAKAWRTFAEAVDDVIGPVNGKAGSIILHNKGEAIDAFELFWSRYHKSEGVGWLDDTAAAARAMAKALEEFADAVDDAIEQLWIEIGIGATVIAAGVGLAVFTFGASTAASAAATATIIEVAAGLGVTVSTTVATITATTLTGIAFGAIEGITIDLAVAQPLRMATGLQDGFSLDSVEQAGIYGGAFGGAFGGAAGAGRVAGEVGGFRNLYGQDIPIGIANPNLAGLGRGPLVLDDMGKRRTWDLFRSEDSKTPVPPKVPGDHALISGDPVYFGKRVTTIGYDERTLGNTQRVARVPGKHDVVIHGTNQGVFLPGRVNSSGKILMDFEVHPSHISDAIRSNPNYGGGPVRLISCHSGYAAPNSVELPLAQSVANDLGVPVMAPTNKVGTSAGLGMEQTPEIGNNGYWRTFLPMAN
ncbi:hypothetical protein ACIQVO_35445 [Streptomyces sp. NPDC101062]|uniref:WXG100-like domain-containing protein n=1 Tax=unclassified Streptomyces TaxID=2593676 RepID=UPI002E772120|nr:hypothetical protein [Streptomyces sp. JV176]MEE1802901.1 hypothetical protein [Streptomyces sp. JV176]